MVPIFQKESSPNDPRLFWSRPAGGKLGEAPEHFAMRDGYWKLVVDHGESGEQIGRYNLRDDIGEQQDLAASFPQRAGAMRATIRWWRADVARGATPIPSPPEDEWGPEFIPTWPSSKSG